MPRVRQVEPPSLNVLVNRAMAEYGYEMPDIETGDLPRDDGGTAPAVRVTLTGSPTYRSIEAVCPVLSGPAKPRTRLAARSALAHALDMVAEPDGVRGADVVA